MLLLPPGNLRKKDWIVRPVALETARRMVEDYHYARGGSNTAVACYGLFHRDRALWDRDCYGVTWWLPAIRKAAISAYPENPNAVLTLSRMVIHPGAPRNAATFLLARSVKMLDPKWECLVTYADTWQGHTGGIYKAANWRYTGTTRPTWAYTKGGRSMGPKRAGKTYSKDEMIALGFEAHGPFVKHRYIFYRNQAA